MKLFDRAFLIHLIFKNNTLLQAGSLPVANWHRYIPLCSYWRYQFLCSRCLKMKPNANLKAEWWLAANDAKSDGTACKSQSPPMKAILIHFTSCSWLTRYPAAGRNRNQLARGRCVVSDPAIQSFIYSIAGYRKWLIYIYRKVHAPERMNAQIDDIYCITDAHGLF
jgi:hypothetical protein